MTRTLAAAVIVFILSTLFCSAAEETNSIIFRDSALLFDVPSEKWSLMDSRYINEASLRMYVREGIVDSAGRNIRPTFAVICEGVADNQELVVYSAFKRINNPFQVNKVFTHEDGIVKIKHALGYIGAYKDSRGVDHTILVIHAINNKVGYQISIDSTSEV